MIQKWHNHENQYQMLKESANIEEMRKKAQGPEWQAFSPAPAADAAR
jgi:catechol-2,3-dioxygenase